MGQRKVLIEQSGRFDIRKMNTREGKKMKEILQSSLFGNIIGIISLLIGGFSLLVTIATMKSAKNIENEMRQAQIKAVDKKQFNEYKEKCIKKLESSRKNVIKEKILSYAFCMDMISIFNDLRGFETILSANDIKMINKKSKELQIISKVLYNREDGRRADPDDLQQFDEIVSTVLSILKKGEYSL